MRLRTYRDQQGLTQDELGALIGVSGVTVSRYEVGARIPGKAEMLRIVEVTGHAVTPNDFYDLPTAAQPESEAA